MSALPSRFSSLRDAAILLLWGTGVLILAGSGKLPSYLHPSLQPFTLAGGIVLILLAGFALAKAFAHRGGSMHACHCHHDHPEHGHDDHDCNGSPSDIHDHTHDHDDAHDHHHDHGVTSFPVLAAKSFVLLIPVAAALSIGAGGYSSAVVRNRGVVEDLSKLPAAKVTAAKSSSEGATAALAASSSTSATSTGGPMPLQVIDMLYALQMPSYREEFEGKDVEMVAQYVPMTTGNPRGDRFQGVRMFITCCAADAKPLGVTVRADHFPKVSEMQWLRITGKPTFPMEGGKRTAILEASKVVPCEAPPDPFVY